MIIPSLAYYSIKHPGRQYGLDKRMKAYLDHLILNPTTLLDVLREPQASIVHLHYMAHHRLHMIVTSVAQFKFALLHAKPTSSTQPLLI